MALAAHRQLLGRVGTSFENVIFNYVGDLSLLLGWGLYVYQDREVLRREAVSKRLLRNSSLGRTSLVSSGLFSDVSVGKVTLEHLESHPDSPGGCALQFIWRCRGRLHCWLLTHATC